MTNAKRDRFSRMFPNRVDNLRDNLRKIANCSNKASYEWDKEKVHEAFILISEEFTTTAKCFGVGFNVDVTHLD